MKQNDFDNLSSDSEASIESSITSFENSDDQDGTKTTQTESEANSETKGVLERMQGPGVALMKKDRMLGFKKVKSKALLP